MPHPAHPAEPAASGPAAVDVVDEYLRGLPGGARRVAHADLPVSAVDEVALDRLLGLVVEAVVTVRGSERVHES
jgi:Glu-tRNA(Gln) amidotransferase subunit E-like FAD-binding protein